jgi:redox-sensitive bicupin YhaK (pirin superfamily)
MITPRKSQDRGHFNLGWLDTYHTFSFGEYHDPQHLQFHSLRVINEDVVAPGAGFGMHPHRDMEIVTYVLSGALRHEDSMGHGEVLRPGEVQRMTAGTGVRHSEFNASKTEPVHLLQVWLLPERKGLTPGYEQKAFPEVERRNRLRIVASPDARDGSVKIHQDAFIHAALLDTGAAVQHSLATARHAWVHVARGDIDLNDTRLGPGDGAAVSNETQLTIRAERDAEFLLFDLA